MCKQWSIRSLLENRSAGYKTQSSGVSASASTFIRNANIAPGIVAIAKYCSVSGFACVADRSTRYGGARYRISGIALEFVAADRMRASLRAGRFDGGAVEQVADPTQPLIGRVAWGVVAAGNDKVVDRGTEGAHLGDRFCGPRRAH
jgi:hypothetical protein